MYYYNARFYEPELGRFLNSDPARSGVNWYEYASDNPITHYDPTGLADPIATDEGTSSVLGKPSQPTSSSIGAAGEKAFPELAKQAGQKVIYGEGKPTNANGLDYLTYDPKTGKINIVDVKEVATDKTLTTQNAGALATDKGRAAYLAQAKTILSKLPDGPVKTELLDQMAKGNYQFELATTGAGGGKIIRLGSGVSASIADVANKLSFRNYSETPEVAAPEAPKRMTVEPTSRGGGGLGGGGGLSGIRPLPMQDPESFVEPGGAGGEGGGVQFIDSGIKSGRI